MSDQFSTVRTLAVGSGRVHGATPALGAKETESPPAGAGEKGGLSTTRSDSPTVDAFGATDRGRKRNANEDQFLIAEL
jgi:hypothetical protein